MFSVSVTGNYVLPGKYEIRPMVSPTNRLLVFFQRKNALPHPKNEALVSFRAL